MSKNTSITLGKHFEGFIKSKIDSGRFSNVSEVVRAGLRLLEDEDAKIEALRQALLEGENSGTPKPFDNEKFKSRMHEKYVR